jgi:RimJ/RimL family protein N-acetyltransferase
MRGFATARLTAQPVTEADAPFLLALWSDRRVTEMTGGARTAEQTGAALSQAVRHWRVHGFGRWIIRDAAGSANPAQKGARTRRSHSALARYSRTGIFLANP